MSRMPSEWEVTGGRAYRAFVANQGLQLTSIESGWDRRRALDALLAERDALNGQAKGPFGADYVLCDAEGKLLKVVELKTKATGNSSIGFPERQVRTAKHLGPYYRLVCCSATGHDRRWPLWTTRRTSSGARSSWVLIDL